MVSDYSDAGQERWLAGQGIAPLRGIGRLAGTGVVEVDGVPHTAEHVVVATGSEPVVPPVPGLRELEGIWTSREATGMKSVPRRLLVLGGGAVGVEMAQAVRRLGGEVVLVEIAFDGVQASPRTAGIGLETVGIEAGARGIPVDARLRAGERLWAIGDVTGLLAFTHVGKYQGEVVAANLLGEQRKADYDAVPRVVYTDPQAASVGATEGRFSATARLSEVAKTATYTRAYAESNGFLTLLTDGERLTGAYAVGPEAGEWLQQATLAIRAGVPLDVLRDTIQPFPTFSEIYVAVLKALPGERPMPPEPIMAAHDRADES